MSELSQSKAKEILIAVKVSPDYYSATITVEYGDAGGLLTKDMIMNALGQKNISFGIEYGIIDELIENQKDVKDAIVARGMPHESGEDGVISYLVNTDTEKKPMELDGGKVNFKELGFVRSVSRGEVLATKTIPTEGSSGTTVTNKIINTRPGKPTNFKFGRNVELSEDGLSIIASSDGTINFDGDRISLIEILEIQGDVGIKTGNIKFAGKVFISGNVTAGYEVECDDDVEIRGIVEGANIKAKGNLTILQGVQGNDMASLEIGGNLHAKFLNNCRAIVKGNVETESILHCFILCDGNLIVSGKKGIIVGGELDVRHEIHAKVIGSDTGTSTLLRLGLDSKLIEEFKMVSDSLKAVKDNHKKLEQILIILKKQLDVDPQNEDIIENYNKTLSSYKKISSENTELTKKFSDMNETINQLQDSKVRVDKLQVGTKIKIGNSFYLPKNDLINVVVKKEGGNVIAVPY